MSQDDTNAGDGSADGTEAAPTKRSPPTAESSTAAASIESPSLGITAIATTSFYSPSPSTVVNGVGQEQSEQKSVHAEHFTDDPVTEATTEIVSSVVLAIDLTSPSYSSLSSSSSTSSSASAATVAVSLASIATKSSPQSGSSNCSNSVSTITANSEAVSAATTTTPATFVAEGTVSELSNQNSSNTNTSGTLSNSSAIPSTATTPTTTDLTAKGTRRRVKLYKSNANRTWDECGTGHASSSYVDRLNGMCLLVKAEADGSLLLESPILADTTYRRQQDTLIIWSEGESYDLALSFQERTGCEEIWAEISQVQEKGPSIEIFQHLMQNDENELPPCESDRLDEIASIICSSLRIQAKKESLTIALETYNYIPKLLILFRNLEEQKDIPSLQKMYDIFRGIFLLNQNTLFDIMFSEEHLWDVIGVFEYDPLGATVKEGNVTAHSSEDDSLGQKKAALASTPSVPGTPGPAATTARTSYFSSVPPSFETELNRLIREKRHRAFLRNVSRFKEVIPPSKGDLVAKIHQTYRVQYIQDFILPTPSAFENILSALSSFICFNKMEIVRLIQKDGDFLRELFTQLADDTPSFNEKRRDLVLFLKELCTTSSTLPLQSRERFIKTLVDLGLLHAVELLLTAEDSILKLGAVDILTFIVDYRPSLVQEYALQQEANTEDIEKYIINIIIVQMICDTDPDPGMATQLSNILKLLIVPNNMPNASNINKSENPQFLNYFYKYCFCFLTNPLQNTTIIEATVVSGAEEPTDSEIAAQRAILECRRVGGLKRSCESVQLYAIILELLTFCIEHHAYHIRGYLLSREILRPIMTLTKSRHTFLVLAVIRFVRRLVGLKDEVYNHHLITGNHFAPIIEAFLENRGRYNLLDSAVCDLFEFIYLNHLYSLNNYTMENFWEGKLERIDYIRTFKCMRKVYESQHPMGMGEMLDTQSFLLARSRRYRHLRVVDNKEDVWFNVEDDDEEEEVSFDDDEEEECEAYDEDEDSQRWTVSPPSSGRQVTPDGGDEVNQLDFQGLPFGCGSSQGSRQKHSSGGKKNRHGVVRKTKTLTINLKTSKTSRLDLTIGKHGPSSPPQSLFAKTFATATSQSVLISAPDAMSVPVAAAGEALDGNQFRKVIARKASLFDDPDEDSDEDDDEAILEYPPEEDDDEETEEGDASSSLGGLVPGGTNRPTVSYFSASDFLRLIGEEDDETIRRHSGHSKTHRHQQQQQQPAHKGQLVNSHEEEAVVASVLAGPSAAIEAEIEEDESDDDVEGDDALLVSSNKMAMTTMTPTGKVSTSGGDVKLDFSTLAKEIEAIDSEGVVRSQEDATRPSSSKRCHSEFEEIPITTTTTTGESDEEEEEDESMTSSWTSDASTPKRVRYSFEEVHQSEHTPTASDPAGRNSSDASSGEALRALSLSISGDEPSPNPKKVEDEE